jgi:hypothetical protein
LRAIGAGWTGGVEVERKEARGGSHETVFLGRLRLKTSGYTDEKPRERG